MSKECNNWSGKTSFFPWSFLSKHFNLAQPLFTLANYYWQLRITYFVHYGYNATNELADTSEIIDFCRAVALFMIKNIFFLGTTKYANIIYNLYKSVWGSFTTMIKYVK